MTLYRAKYNGLEFQIDSPYDASVFTICNGKIRLLRSLIIDLNKEIPSIISWWLIFSRVSVRSFNMELASNAKVD